ncbi:MAG TPA: YraN family protein [Telluria sp.]|nr:YraN family protein [Telluria sp.]
MWPSKRSPQQEQGRYWEQYALAWLRTRGFELIEENFRCSGGEIDLVMRDGDTVVFVEVRQRDDPQHGGAAASIGPAKIRRLVCAARWWLLRCDRLPPCRFDVIAIDGDHLDWLRDAIQVD